MTKICLEQNTEAWFEMEGGGQVHLQMFTVDDFKNVKQQTVEKKVEFRRVDGKAERFEFDKTNETLRDELFWDRIILEWKDLYDSNSNPIECTRANKILLMTKSLKFASFITESLEKLREMDTQRIEDVEKN